MFGILFWLSIFLIIYIYAGYPIIITILARLFPKPIMESDYKPFVTIIIAAHNEDSVIEDKIINSLHLDYPIELLQIIVTDDGSTDQTANIVRKYYGQVDLVHSENRLGKMAAINRAIPSAKGDIILFSDANNMYDSNVINLLVTPFGDPDVGAVSGSKIFTKSNTHIGESEGAYWKYESYIKKQESRFLSCMGVTGEILAIRKILYVEPTKKIINDDFYTLLQVLRKGFRSVYVPDAISIEESSRSAKDEITRRTRIIAGRYQILITGFRQLPWNNPLAVWQIISHKYLRLFLPFLMVLAFISNLGAVIWSYSVVNLGWLWLSRPFNYFFFTIQTIFYIIAFLGNSIQWKSPIKKILYLPTFLVNSNYAALVGLLRYVTGKQQVTWEKINRNKSNI